MLLTAGVGIVLFDAVVEVTAPNETDMPRLNGGFSGDAMLPKDDIF